MKANAYYNENDPYAAEWLRNLIKAGHIAPGEVDERSIEDVRPDELRGFVQCHFFAGIGVWSYAFRRAGWPDDREVWTGSCPCQPFSTAGKGKGADDERHLWPAFHWLIQQCRPHVIFGEQVASKDGLAWLDLVQTDLENTGYTSGAVDFCAAGVGAPCIRQRIWFVAERMGNASDKGLEGYPRNGDRSSQSRREQTNKDRPVAETSGTSRMADTKHNGLHRTQRDAAKPGSDRTKDRIPLGGGTGLWGADRADSIDGYWCDVDWLGCRDGKWRPVEPGTFPLADGITSRVGRLRAYGNAIVAPAAEEIIKAYLDG